jgi:hypothetical protein
MTEADRNDIIFELHLADSEAEQNATLVRLVRAYPELRENLVNHFVEIILMEFRAAAHPEPAPAEPVIVEGAWRRFLAGVGAGPATR